MENKGVFIKASVEKHERSNNLSATGSRQAPRNVFAFSNRAKNPSTRSVKHAKTKEKKAIAHCALIIATIITGIIIIRARVKSVGIVMRFSAFGKRLKIRNLKRARLTLTTQSFTLLRTEYPFRPRLTISMRLNNRTPHTYITIVKHCILPRSNTLILSGNFY